MNKKTAKKIISDNKAMYDKIAPHFAATRSGNRPPWPEMTSFISKYIRSDQCILDIGCGNGRLFSLLKDKKVNYTGIDNSSMLINEAKRAYPNHEELFKVKDVLDIKSKKKYDIIFLIAVLHHVPSNILRKDAISKIRTALKPNGILIMTNWNLWQRGKFKFICKNIFKKISGRSNLDWNDAYIPWNYSGKIFNRYVHAFTRREIKSLLTPEFKLIDNRYFKKNKLESYRNGYNLVTIAEKTSNNP